MAALFNDPGVFGLIKGHAYTVLSAYGEDGPIRLVKVRNPWGNEAEWTGDWSDRSDTCFEYIRFTSYPFQKDNDSHKQLGCSLTCQFFRFFRKCRNRPKLVSYVMLPFLVTEAKSKCWVDGFESFSFIFV